jgi:hypothetical protein
MMTIDGSVADPGCLSLIPDAVFSIPNPGSSIDKIPDPGSLIRILIKEFKFF